MDFETPKTVYSSSSFFFPQIFFFSHNLTHFCKQSLLSSEVSHRNWACFTCLATLPAWYLITGFGSDVCCPCTPLLKPQAGWETSSLPHCSGWVPLIWELLWDRRKWSGNQISKGVNCQGKSALSNMMYTCVEKLQQVGLNYELLLKSKKFSSCGFF